MGESIDDVFIQALEQNDPRARDSYLSSACAGDNNLREQVDRLLAIEQRLGSFLETPLHCTGWGIRNLNLKTSNSVAQSWGHID